MTEVKKNGCGYCSSTIGRWGGMQDLNLGKCCYRIGTIQHEFLHALGFYHEQSRSDRDRYVTIIKENILPDTKKMNYTRNFEKYKTANQGFGYEYGSVMHYPADAFSKNGKLTIATKGGQ